MTPLPMADPSSSRLSEWIRRLPQLVPERWCLQCKVCCRFPDTRQVQTPTWSRLEAGWLSGESERPTEPGTPPDLIRFAEQIESDGDGEEVPQARRRGRPVDWLRGDPASSSLSPTLQPCGEGSYRCPAFETGTSRCTIYADRPLDCRLYPFVLAQDPGETKVVLAMDLKCPYLQRHAAEAEVSAYAQALAQILETPEGLSYLKANPKIVGPSWPEFVPVAALPMATGWIQKEQGLPPHPALRRFRFEDRPLLEEALSRGAHLSASHTVAGLLGWMDLMPLWWTNLEGRFCLFAEQAGGFFMPVPPLGRPLQRRVIQEVWGILSQLNRGAAVSRIEGIEPREARELQDQGVALAQGESEYLYRREDLVALRGSRHRSHRWALHRCRRAAADAVVRPYKEEDLTACLQLYTLWGIQKGRKHPLEAYPKALIRDGLFFHRRLMVSHREFGLTGRVLETEGRIRGYTFAAPVGQRIACIFLEIADRTLPGAAQLLFHAMCKALPEVVWINAMGDCGLPGLRRAKQAYGPVELLPVSVLTNLKASRR